MSALTTAAQDDDAGDGGRGRTDEEQTHRPLCNHVMSRYVQRPFKTFKGGKHTNTTQSVMADLMKHRTKSDASQPSDPDAIAGAAQSVWVGLWQCCWDYAIKVSQLQIIDYLFKK